FAVLYTIFAWFEGALNFELGVDALQHLLQDIGYGLVLENATLKAFCEQPQLGNQFDEVRGECVIAGSLGTALHNTIEVTLLILRQFETDGHFLSQQFVESDVDLIWGDQFQPVTEET